MVKADDKHSENDEDIMGHASDASASAGLTDESSSINGAGGGGTGGGTGGGDGAESTDDVDSAGSADAGETISKREFNITWRTCMKLVVSALVLFLLIRYWGAVENVVALFFGGLLAIFAGLVISYVVNIPLRFFERKLPGPKGDGTLNRTLALVLSVVCVVAVMLFVGILVIPHLVEAIVTLAKDTPALIDSITSNPVIASFIPAQLLTQLKSIDWSQLVTDVAGWLQSGVVSSLPQITSLIGQIGAWFMGIVLAFWFLGEKNRLSERAHLLIRTYISPGADDRFSRATAFADESFRGYIVGQSLEALLFGSLVAIASAIAGLPGAFMLGALVGVMSFIPMIGALIGAVLGAIIILATSWQKALVFLVVFFIVQQIEANFLYPRVVGKHVGLTGLWPLIGITLGVAMLGFAGAFVGVPITATIFRMVEANLSSREENPDGGASPLERLQKSLLN